MSETTTCPCGWPTAHLNEAPDVVRCIGSGGCNRSYYSEVKDDVITIPSRYVHEEEEAPTFKPPFECPTCHHRGKYPSWRLRMKGRCDKCNTVFTPDPSHCVPVEEETTSPCLKAHKLVNSDRGDAYGHPLDDFACVTEMWGAYRKRQLAGGTRQAHEMLPEDHAVYMILVKLARLANTEGHPDSIVDGCGYFETLQMVFDEKARRAAVSWPPPELAGRDDFVEVHVRGKFPPVPKAGKHKDIPAEKEPLPFCPRHHSTTCTCCSPAICTACGEQWSEAALQTHTCDCGNHTYTQK